MTPVIFITFALFVLAAANESNDDTISSMDACSMPPDLEDCGEEEQRWFYDAEQQMCALFTYKGCNSSPNNFASKEECETICVYTDEEPAIEESTDLVDGQDDSDDTVSNTVVHLELDEDSEEPSSMETQTDENDEQYFEDIVREQDAMADQFNMADSRDMLTLDRLMQSPNMEVAEVIEETPEMVEQEGDVEGVMYKEMPAEGEGEIYEEEDQMRQREYEENVEEPYEEQEEQQEPTEDASESEQTDEEQTSEDQEDETENQAEDQLEDEESEAEYLRQTEEEQDALLEQFGMGDKSDIITLETLMQTSNMDVGEIVDNTDGTHTGQVMGYLYKEGYEPEPEDDEEESYEESEDMNVFANEQEYVEPIENEPEDAAQPMEESSEILEDESNEAEVYNSDEEVVEPASEESIEEDEEEQAIADTLEMEEQLEKDMRIDDVKDLLTLEQMLQSDNMDLADIMNRNKVDEVENGDLEGYMLKEVPVEENEQTDDGDDDGGAVYEENEVYYEKNLEEEDVNPDFGENMEEMKENVEQFADNFNDDMYGDNNGFEMNYDNTFRPENYFDDTQMMSAEIPQSDTMEENTDFENEKEDISNENIMKLEEHIEDRFNMADPADLLALEDLVQKPQLDLMEFMPKEENENSGEGDHIDGVLSYAASFLGKDDQRDIQGLRKQLRESFNEVNGQDMVNNEENEIEQGENELEVSPTTQPVLAAIEKANYKDKQTLINMLHNDLFEMNKLKGSFPDAKEGDIIVEEDRVWRKPRKEGSKRVPKCCKLPKDPGPCKGRKLQWHFDPFVGTCLPFHYGGCAGNRNRFDTIGACLMKCGGARDAPEESLPEPVVEPAPFHPPVVAIKSFVSNMFPKKVLKPAKFMSNGQDKFLRMISNAMKHVSEIKPVQISPMKARVFPENDDDKRPPIPLKSVMFKWPIVRMIFDKRSRSGKILPPLAPRPLGPEAREGRIRDEIFPAPRFPPPPPREARLSMAQEKRFPPPPPRDMRSDRRPEIRPPPPPPETRPEMRPHFERSTSKHFAPSYSKQFKAMSHHEDNRHHMTSDPKNKVNLIQVFVNKPHNEAKAEPQHHHTMIKKHQFSSGGDYHAVPSPYHSSYHGPSHPPYYPRPSYQFHPPIYPPRYMGSHHEHSHEHTHRDPHGERYSHSHPHDPHHHHHPSQPWWAKKAPPPQHPYYDSREMKHSIPPQFHPNIRPSTSYPEVEEVETEVIQEVDGSEFEEGTDENVVVVTVPPGDDNDEPHYACLLPLSTGVCKAFEEKYYYNIETRSCELFFYGGCGGNANNFNTRADCEQTCMRTTPVSADGLETTTLPDDTIYITSPVYEPNAPADEESEEKSQEEESRDSAEDVSDDVKVEDTKESDVNDAKIAVDAKFDFLPEHIEVLAEPVAHGGEQRELLWAVACFVALAATALVCLAGANLVKKKETSKKEKVIEAVLASHLERGGSSGSETPRMLYYGQPPSETGPPPITDIPKLHQDSASLKEQV